MGASLACSGGSRREVLTQQQEVWGHAQYPDAEGFFNSK